MVEERSRSAACVLASLGHVPGEMEAGPNGTRLSENLYVAWLYAGFGVDAREDYINEHGFNKPKFTCSVAKYTADHIRITFRSVAG
jgi:hypothetical protein